MNRIPTPETYEALQAAYDHFNATLFGGLLPACLITLQRRPKSYGYFHAGQFAERVGDGQLDEIAMHPEHFNRSDEAILSTLVHEQVHLWQQHFGKPPRSSYHDRQWADQMEQVGLIPSSSAAVRAEAGPRRCGAPVARPA